MEVSTVNELNEEQNEIYNFYQEHTLKQTCERFNKKEHQVNYIIEKKKKLNASETLNAFVRLQIFEENISELTIRINDIKVKAPIDVLKVLLGVSND